jgi:protein TonB
MFDLILDKVDRPYRTRSKGATVVALFGHVLLIACVFVLPILYVTDSLPKVPVMMAFVATAPEAPPPPPPPAPPARAASEVRQTAASTSSSPNAAPIEAPQEIKPELPTPPSGESRLGGVEGGIAGGVDGGIVGGLIAAPPPPPAPSVPPPPAPPRELVRIGGLVVAPALVRRVEPEYPAIAVAAHIEGMVILEATVDTDGLVKEVRILRSGGLLDKAAIEAVSRWRYAPLMLNGIPTRFVLTVMLNFALTQHAKDVG